MRTREHLLNALAAGLAALPPRPAPRPVERLLVVGYGAIGDTIFFLPVLRALRLAYPRARLVWLSNPAPVADELIPATGLADEVWRWEAHAAEDPAGRAAINRRVAEAAFDLAVLAIGAPAHQFVAGLSRIPVVAGHWMPWQGVKRFFVFGDYARRVLVNRPAPARLDEHVLERNRRLLDALGIASAGARDRPSLPVPPSERRRADALLAGLARPLVAVHLGPPRNQYHKMWAPERFADLSRRLARAGRGALVLVGAAEEAETERRFLDAGGVRARSLAGATGLLGTLAVLERCALLVSNDTGVAKAAAALGVPTATLWGPSDPGEVGVAWPGGRHLDVRTGIACSPCARFSAAVPKPLNYLTCGHHDCLGKMEAGAVFQALRARYGDILDKGDVPPHTST